MPLLLLARLVVVCCKSVEEVDPQHGILDLHCCHGIHNSHDLFSTTHLFPSAERCLFSSSVLAKMKGAVERRTLKASFLGNLGDVMLLG